MYLYLSYKDSLSVLPSNIPSDFTTILPDTYNLKGGYQVALVEILYNGSPLVGKFTVHSDICDTSIYKGSHYRLLRLIPVGVQSFNSLWIPQYIDITSSVIKSIRITVLDYDLKPVKIEGELTCLLHLTAK